MKTIFALAIAGAASLCAQQFDVTVAAPVPPSPPSVTANRTFMFVAGEMVGGKPVSGAPYSAESSTETTQQLADGNRIVNRTSANIYRDSEGRERREQSLPNIGGFAPKNGKTVFISDPVSKVNYSLDVENKTAVKMPAPALPPVPPVPPPPPGASTRQVETNVMIRRGEAGVAVAGIAGPGLPGTGLPGPGPQMVYFHNEGVGPKQDSKIEQLGSKLIEGVQTTGTRVTTTIPAGQMGNEKPIEIVDERWFSQDLNVTVYSEHSDPRMGKTVYSLKNISRAEPSPTLFQVPADYTLSEPKMQIQKFEK